MPATLSVLERLARQAGSILRAGYDKEHQVDYPGLSPVADTGLDTSNKYRDNIE